MKHFFGLTQLLLSCLQEQSAPFCKNRHDELVFPTFLASTISVHVAGSTLEATDGQDFAIPFGAVKLERVEEVKVIFAGEDQKKSLIARYCSYVYIDPSCKPVKTHGVSLQVEERNVSLILQDVNISRSGHYKAQAFCGKDVDEVTATLVVNKASFSSSRAPTHTSTLKPPDSSEHQGLLTAAAIIIIIIIIFIITLVFCFICKWRKMLCFQKRDLESNSSSVTVSMNSCGENTEALLTDT